MLIYKAINIINEKMYIGQTVNSLEHRKNQHINAALNKENNMYFGRAIRKYGPDNFTWEILRECDTIEELNRLEIYYIGLYDTFENGYNLTEGGGGSVGFRHSKETRERLSEIHMGKTLSISHKKRISKVMKSMKLHNATGIIIDDQYFDTRVKAAKFIGVSPALIRQRILHKTKWLDYSYV